MTDAHNGQARKWKTCNEWTNQENIEHFFKNIIREYFSSNLYRSLAISKFTVLEGKAIFIIIKENFGKLLTYIESIDLWLFLRFLAFENS